MKRARIAVVAAAAAALLVTGALSATASDTPPPPPAPEWVNADGTVDESKMPAGMAVIGPDGKDLKDASGKTITVDPRSGVPDYDPGPRCARCPAEPPPNPDAGDTHSVVTDNELFPTCGRSLAVGLTEAPPVTWTA